MPDLCFEPIEGSVDIVYLLLNSSFPKLCKIGFTTNSLESRVQTLSAATGVPTAFVVAWWENVCNGALAEREIHETLAQFRENSRREFFRVDCKAAIRVVQQICLKYPVDNRVVLRETDFGPWLGVVRVSEQRKVIQIERVFIRPHDWEAALNLVLESSRFGYSPSQLLSLFLPGEQIEARLR